MAHLITWVFTVYFVGGGRGVVFSLMRGGRGGGGGDTHQIVIFGLFDRIWPR